MRFLLLARYSHSGTGRLLDAIQKRGHTGEVVESLETAKAYESQWGGVDVLIPRVSFVTYELAQQVCRYFETRDTLLAASAVGIQTSFDKFLTYQQFKAAGLPTPATELLNGQPTLPYPLIIKPANQNRGAGIELVRDASALTTAQAQLSSSYDRLVVQEYIAESRGADMRLVVIGDKVVAAMHRRGLPGELVSNLSQGGKATAFRPDAQLQELAIRAAACFDAVIAGVDIIMSVRGPLVLEVNVSFGLKIEDVTGVPVTDMIVREFEERRAGVRHTNS